jgi:hypothetical protein
MRRIPLGTWALLGLLAALLAVLGLFEATRHSTASERPIVREINDIVATIQAPLEGLTGLDAPSGPRAWAMLAGLFGLGAAAWGVRRVRRLQQRSRSIRS